MPARGGRARRRIGRHVVSRPAPGDGGYVDRISRSFQWSDDSAERPEQVVFDRGRSAIVVDLRTVNLQFPIVIISDGLWIIHIERTSVQKIVVDPFKIPDFSARLRRQLF